jgi:hypothetical protein
MASQTALDRLPLGYEIVAFHASGATFLFAMHGVGASVMEILYSPKP